MKDVFNSHVMADKAGKIVIVGAGPVGVETALYAQFLGFETILIERSNQVGASMHSWRHLPLFSEWFDTISPLGLELLLKQQPHTFQELSGDCLVSDYLERYLRPLHHTLDHVEVCLNTEVLQISRDGVTKLEPLGEVRSQNPFRILVKELGSGERLITADIVVDASGAQSHVLPISSSSPVIGERNLLNNKSDYPNTTYGIVDFSEKASDYHGKTILVIGSDYETACSLNSALDVLMHEPHPDTTLIWLTENRLKPPISTLSDDIFPKRVKWLNKANAIAHHAYANVRFIGNVKIQEIQMESPQLIIHYLTSDKQLERLSVDKLIVSNRFVASDEFLQHLQVHRCYASDAPMSLAAAMLSENANHKCLPWALRKETLRTSEPNFFILGAKSYGRSPGFAIKVGLGQIVGLFQLLTEDDDLNLYHHFKYHLADSPADLLYLEPDCSQSTPRAKKTSINPKPSSSSEQVYKTITDNLQEVIFQTDLKQRISYLSPSWQVMTGFTSQNYIGKDWQELLYVNDINKALAQCNAFMSNSLNEYHEEFRVLCSDGSLRWVEVKASVLHDQNDTAYGTIGSMVDITDRVHAIQRLNDANKEILRKNKALDELSVKDDLTGLYNRRYFNSFLDSEWRRSVRHNLPISVILCDIDYFKLYNDYYGHIQGDHCLREVAQVLKRSVLRSSDRVARYGGEEFALVLPHAGHVEAERIAERVRQAVVQLKIEHYYADSFHEVTLSCGVASTVPNLGDDASELVRLADKALYASKAKGRNCVSVSI